MRTVRNFMSENEVSSQQEADFKKLQEAQRGKPEKIMVKLQMTYGGGVLNPVVEHVGDLTNRMAKVVILPGWAQDAVYEKVKKTLRWLKNRYGFEREMEENIENNASAKGKNKDEFKKTIYDLLDKYAEAHSKLPVFNEMQWHARESAVELGKRNFNKAINHLEWIEGYMKDDDKFLEKLKEYEPKKYK